MAKQIIGKNIGKSGSTPGNRVAILVDGTELITADDLTFDFSFNGVDSVEVTFKPRVIASVINMGTGNATVDGRSFATGKWDFSQYGAIRLGTDTPIISGDNVIVEFRS